MCVCKYIYIDTYREGDLVYIIHQFSSGKLSSYNFLQRILYTYICIYIHSFPELRAGFNKGRARIECPLISVPTQRARFFFLHIIFFYKFKIQLHVQSYPFDLVHYEYVPKSLNTL